MHEMWLHWHSVLCVWRRYFAVYRKNWLYAITTTFVDPLLYLTAFGFGLGHMVGTVNTGGVELTYRQFVLCGIVAQTVLFQGFFEAAYGAFIRLYYQKIFQAIAVTPITLDEVLFGELLWDTSKSMFAASVVLLIGLVIGDFDPLGVLAALPLCFIGALLFSALGLWVAAISKTIESISYPQYLLIFPMFLFCGVFFPLENLPDPIEQVVWLLPLTPLVDILRHWLVGTALNSVSYYILIGWLVGLIYFSRKKMIQRLVK